MSLYVCIQLLWYPQRQDRVLDLTELELQRAVNHFVGVAGVAVNHWAISLALYACTLNKAYFKNAMTRSIPPLMGVLLQCASIDKTCLGINWVITQGSQYVCSEDVSIRTCFVGLRDLCIHTEPWAQKVTHSSVNGEWLPFILKFIISSLNFCSIKWRCMGNR